MIPKWFKYGWLFILLLLLQVTVLDNIYLFKLLHPYLYILFILTLPISTPKWLLLILSFAAGLVLDLFNNTPGMHASACVFIGFMRPSILQLYPPKDEDVTELAPHIHTLGLFNFLMYALILTFLHHLVLMFVEVFELAEFEHTLLRVVVNTGVSFLLIVVTDVLIFFPNSRSSR